MVFTGDNIITSNKKYLEAFLKKANGLSAPYYVALGHKDLNKKKGLSKEEYIKTLKTSKIAGYKQQILYILTTAKV